MLLLACHPTHGYKIQGKVKVTENELNPIIPKESALLFKTKFDLYTNHFSGLMLVKQTDSISQHLTFVNEIGMKIFDFEVQKNNMRLVYIFEAINQPKIIALLKNDLQLLFLLSLFQTESSLYTKNTNTLYKTDHPAKTYYFCDSTKTIQKTWVRGTLKTKIKTTYTYSSNQEVEEIYLRHTGLLPVKMRLTKLPANHNQTP